MVISEQVLLYLDLFSSISDLKKDIFWSGKSSYFAHGTFSDFCPELGVGFYSSKGLYSHEYSNSVIIITFPGHCNNIVQYSHRPSVWNHNIIQQENKQYSTLYNTLKQNSRNTDRPWVEDKI